MLGKVIINSLVFLTLMTTVTISVADGELEFLLGGSKVTEEPYITRIYTSAPLHTKVTSVSVRYVENNTYSNTTVEISLSGDDSSSFSYTNGSMFTNEDPFISRNIHSNYTFVLQAAVNLPSSERTVKNVLVHVIVSARNIFPPLLPTKTTLVEVAYQNGLTKDSFNVAQIRATDADVEDYNRQTLHSLVVLDNMDHPSVAEMAGIFTMNPEDGTISTTRRLKIGDVDFEHHLAVHARNTGSPALTSVSTLIIVFRAFSAVRQIAITTLPQGPLVCFHPPEFGSSRMSSRMFTIEHRKQGTNDVGTTEITNVRGGSLICRTLDHLGSDDAYQLRIWAHDGTHSGVKTTKWTQSPKPACASTVCKNNGTCVDDDNGGFRCECTAGYEGELCDSHKCDSVKCQNGGSCMTYSSGETKCACSPGFSGYLCGRIATCRIVGEGMLIWPATPFNTTSTINCPKSLAAGNIVNISRECKLIGNEAKWAPFTGSCPKVLTPGDAVRELDAAANQLHGKNDISKVEQGTELVERVVGLATRNAKVALSMVRVISSLLDVTSDLFAVNNTANRIVKVMEGFCRNVQMNDTSIFELKTENVQLKVEEVNTTSTDVAEFIAPQHGEYGMADITIPKEALDFANGSEVARVTIIHYMNSKFFVNKTQNPEGKPQVISSTIEGVAVNHLNGCINYTFNSQVGRNYTCNYWQEDGQYWSNEGVFTMTTGGALTTCCSKHLTSFSILLDADPGTKTGDLDNTILTVISYCGCALSMTGLVLTLLTYTLFRYLSRDRSGQILIQLCIAMLLMNVCYVTATMADSIAPEVCITVGALLHYLVIATFLWMSVEAYNMYRMLITVFKAHERLFILKRCAFAWGIPLIPVVTCLALGTSNYKTEDHCTLSPGNSYLYYGAFVGPVCAIMLLNAVVFVLVVRVLLTPRFDKTRGASTISKAQIRGVLTVMVMLGASWIFGALGIGDVKVVFQYVFVVSNSFQGFLIFIFRCFIHPEAKAAWSQLFNEGTIKKRRGKIVTSYQPNSSSTNNETVNGYKSKRKSNINNGNEVISFSPNGSVSQTSDSVPPTKTSGQKESKYNTRWLVFANKTYNLNSPNFTNLNNLCEKRAGVAEESSEKYTQRRASGRSDEALCWLNAYKHYLEKEDKNGILKPSKNTNEVQL